MSKYHKYINKNKWGKWGVQKVINKKLKTFKYFDNLSEAITYRDKLIQNNWQELPLTDEEIFEKNRKQYYKHVVLNSYKTAYVIHDHHGNYLGTVKTIEEALYYRDLYSDCEVSVPKPQKCDLITDNPYLIDGLRYPLLDRLIKPEKNTNYGKGQIRRKSKTCFLVKYNKRKFCTCRTYEQAYYVRKCLQECDWDEKQVPKILEDYPKWYTWLMGLYRYIIEDKKTSKYMVTIPKQYTEDNKISRISYHKLEDALYERDFLINNDWDYDLLVECIDDSKNPYYNMELPPYPQRKIRNLSEPKTFETELRTIQNLILEGYTGQEDVAEAMNVAYSNITYWLRRYNTTFKEFTDLVLSGEDPLTVLELKEHIYIPDLSPSKPSNYNGYVHRTQSKRSPYCVARKGEYYGAYKDKKTARKVVKELEKVNWDKKELKKIQNKIGHEEFLNTKRWVYPNTNHSSWCIRKKDKNRKMVNYGNYNDKEVAETVRDVMVVIGWDKDRLSEIRCLCEWYVESKKEGII